jgi:hypothetical protein
MDERDDANVEARERLHARDANARATKQHNDRLMARLTLFGVIVSILATGAAFWASSEARKARIEAGELGKKSLMEQSRSIDAQIKALQADERPYLKTEVSGSELLTFTDADSQQNPHNQHYVRVIAPRIHLVVFGRTPALEVASVEDCTFFTDDGNYPLPEKREVVEIEGTVFQGEKPDVRCNVGRMPLGARVTKSSIIRWEGYVRYKSLYGGSFRTPFCYEHYLSSKDKVSSCTAESPS